MYVFYIGVSKTGYPRFFFQETGTCGSWNEGIGIGIAYICSSYFETGPGTAENRFRYRLPGVIFLAFNILYVKNVMSTNLNYGLSY